MLAVELPEDLSARLTILAETTGQTPKYHVQEAVMEYLDDLEDLHIAQQRLDAIKAGEETYGLEEMMAKYGMED